jgi:hypothetical protein
MKLCKDCKHASRRWFGLVSGGESAYCTIAIEYIHPATGEKSYFYCATERTYGPCGPYAKLFEPR